MSSVQLKDVDDLPTSKQTVKGPFLPDEVITQVFVCLDTPSLLRCMQVCKLFHSIISSSTVLCYKIELLTSYMEDNTHSSMDTATRLDILREYNRVWDHMEWPSSGSIPMYDGDCWKFLGGILAQQTLRNEVFFAQLPSKLKGIAEKRWTVAFDFSIRDFTFDNSQDLLVLIELVGHFPFVSCKVHLRTLSGEHHPCTIVRHITRSLLGLYAPSFLMQICGDHLAILFIDVRSQGLFVVWNWRTGHQKIYTPTHILQSFAFMTEDLILAGVVGCGTSLRVLSISACAHPSLSSRNMPFICELQYPPMMASTGRSLIRSEPTPSWRPPSGSGVPFYCSQRDFLFTIKVRRSSESVRVLIVPLSTLLSEVERSRDIPRRQVDWKDWGPNGTRMLCTEPSATWIYYTYGMKFVHDIYIKEGYARAYDFGRFAATKKVKSCTDSLLRWEPLSASTNTRGGLYRTNFFTTLPGRAVNFKLGQSDEWEWEGVMIGEDHILMVNLYTNEYGYMAM